jgi:hypothetical protein
MSSIDDKDDKQPERAVRKRDDRPKNSPSEDLNYRINGLEKAKTETGMTRADIAALDRSIAKLKEKLAAKNTPKEEAV